jgi:hypothetical protein
MGNRQQVFGSDLNARLDWRRRPTWRPHTNENSNRCRLAVFHFRMDKCIKYLCVRTANRVFASILKIRNVKHSQNYYSNHRFGSTLIALHSENTDYLLKRRLHSSFNDTNDICPSSATLRRRSSSWYSVRYTYIPAFSSRNPKGEAVASFWTRSP